VIFAVLDVSFWALTTVVKLPRKFLTLTNSKWPHDASSASRCEIIAPYHSRRIQVISILQRRLIYTARGVTVCLQQKHAACVRDRSDERVFICLYDARTFHVIIASVDKTFLLDAELDGRSIMISVGIDTSGQRTSSHELQNWSR